jgi:hypothetical protein
MAYNAIDPVRVGTKADKTPTYTRMLDNAEFLREQDKRQAAASIGTVLGEGIGVVITGAAFVNITNPLVIPINTFETSTWRLWVMAEMQRTAGAAGTFDFNVVPSGHNSILSFNDSQYAFANSDTMNGTFVNAFCNVTVLANAAAQFHLRGNRSAGAGTLAVFRAWSLATRIG